jgi:predicted outer membrane repeat protein
MTIMTHPNIRHATAALFVVVMELLFTSSRSFILECKPLPSETMDGFYEFVSSSFGYADVCPFVITGDACRTTTQDYPDGYVVPNGENLYVSCDPYRREAKCIIDCPVQRHFTVSTGASLTLESMILSGAEDSAVYVEPQGQLTVFDSRFDGNHAKNGKRGGAIYALTNTVLQVRFSEFQNNRAEVGGAIFSMGETHIFQSVFQNNFAEAAVSAELGLYNGI